ncbi:peptidyl-prolyl cis-trans isomerase FKBP17-2, chloroplastic [Amborella trichopoda]|uniref:peptidylprolyl isomerase n=1 Tax=Amborella trichopoda TaxID=13333 RepID=W1NTA4_AMBTC|nr:peptidyl-prolyl cis-trans isomerase FKBP17-2, chloroplastic [Amborella trichopoda]ERN00602.1 hypothetical protein AMTR_s00091p00081150 [Amborella trichopoda]|eukprot:XP_006838033.1 peptidyl-prolyl cis-trans isomerase FKBP17-2, chloroplastic [Amborella trichopoda]
MGCIARPVIPFTRTPANGCHTPSIIIQPPTLISTTLITKFESQSQQEESNSSSNNKDGGRKWKEGVRMRKVETTDWVATSLTRRFGLGAGLAWFGFLAFSVVSEQIKTRLEVSQEQAGTLELEREEEKVMDNGIRYWEMRVGGGAMPKTGDLVVIDMVGRIQGTKTVFVDTFASKKPIALIMGSRPYNKGVSEGLESVLRTMRSGGKRRVVIPPNLGFGEQGADLGSGVQIPPSVTLEYTVELDKVSIAPA